MNFFFDGVYTYRVSKLRKQFERIDYGKDLQQLIDLYYLIDDDDRQHRVLNNEPILD